MARTATPKSPEEAQAAARAHLGGNVPDEVLLRNVNACSAAKGRLETAQADYRNTLKIAKADGCSTGAITWYLKAKKRDPQEIDIETRERNRIAKLMALPIGTQLGFLDGQISIADALEDELVDPQAEGRAAHTRGVSREANPYTPIDSRQHVDWDFGWFIEQTRVATAAGAALDKSHTSTSA